MMMQVKNGRVVLPGGASYTVLVFPDQQQMNPNNHVMSLRVAKKILQLLKDGAKIVMSKDYVSGIGLKDNDSDVKLVIKEMLKPGKKGKMMLTPYVDADFKKLGIEKVPNLDHPRSSDLVFDYILQRSGWIKRIG